MTDQLLVSDNLVKQFEDEFNSKSSNYSGDEKLFYESFFGYRKRLEGENEELIKFMGYLKNRTKTDDFTDLIKNFQEMDIYERFLSSIFIYMRIDNIPSSADKFLYLCIAVEAAMNYRLRPNKTKSQLFREFFSLNLSKQSKLKIISSFQNKKVKYIIPGSQLLALKFAKEQGQKVKYVKKEENTWLPACFVMKECYVGYGRCYPETSCAIKDNEIAIDTRLYFVLDYLYSKRSDFVHEGIAFSHPMSIPEKNYTSAGILDAYEDPSTKKYVEVSYHLDFKDLCFLYEEALLNHFTTLNQGGITNGATA